MYCGVIVLSYCYFFFFQAEDGIRDLVRSRGLGDVYKRQLHRRGVRRDRHRGAAGLAAIYQAAPAGADGDRLHLSLIHI